MKKQCRNCKKESITITQLMLLGFGVSVKCGDCRAKLRINSYAQTFASIFLTILTLVLLITLSKQFGVTGFAAAFFIVVAVDIIMGLFLPLEVISKNEKI